MSLRWLYLDMNAYFASVEQQDRPELRGRPVGVVPVEADTSCCIACSYEARAFGVKTGTVVWKARALCPHLTLALARPELYIRTHHRIVEATERHLPVSAIHSIDEMSCRLMRNEADEDTATAIAQNIKREISTTVGDRLKASIGIAPNRLLAKVAGDMHKPDGLTVIRQEDLPHALHHLDLEDLPGIAKRMRARLDRRGVRSVEHLCRLSIDEMRTIWESLIGERWWHWLRGDEVFEPETHRRTVGHEHVLPPRLRTDRGAFSVLTHLTARAAVRLRKLDYWARRMVISVSSPELSVMGGGRWGSGRGGGTWVTKVPLGMTQDTPSILEAATRAWARRPPVEPMIVGVSLIDLLPRISAEAPMFPEEERRLRVSRAVDDANERFGKDAVQFGAMLGATTPLRIPFSAIPEIPPARPTITPGRGKRLPGRRAQRGDEQAPVPRSGGTGGRRNPG